MNNKYDVIIVGAGIGGLTAGTYLAKNGFKTLIIEKESQIGGYCTSFKRGKFNFDSGAHLIGSCDKNQTFAHLLSELDMRVDFIRLNPTDRFFFGVKSKTPDIVEVPQDYHNFVVLLQNMFKTEKDKIALFFQEIAKCSIPGEIPIIVRKYAHMTYQDFLDLHFKDKKLMAILSAQCGFLGLSPKHASALAVIFMLKMYIIDGAYYPTGGAQKLADKFADRFKRFGGYLYKACEVNKIIVENGKAIGVETSTNEKFYASYILSNIDVKKTFNELLNEDVVIQKGDFKDKISDFHISASCFALYCGVTKTVDLVNKNGWYYPDYDIEKSFNKFLYLHIPTNYDQTLIPERDGQILIMYTMCDNNEGANKTYTKYKAEQTAYYIKELEELFPGLAENKIVITAATPRTFERYTSNTAGALYGWAQTKDQVYLNSVPQRTPIGNLYLAGHWTYPGGGIVTVAVSGMNAGRQIIRNRKKCAILK